MYSAEIRTWLNQELIPLIPVASAIVLSNTDPDTYTAEISDVILSEFGSTRTLNVSSFLNADGTIDIDLLHDAVQSSQVRLFQDSDTTPEQLRQFLNDIRTLKELLFSYSFAEVIVTAKERVPISREDVGRVTVIRRM
ncbi:hypothetical protein KBD71_00840 [Candidatus Woesebacteria bacterium]|nr:hypothetical protein [Candidatus Woesebacteria bacterium]